MKKNLLSIIAIFIFSFAAHAQLRAYTFEYSDEFGGKQKCYATLRSIVAEWDAGKLDVLFNCCESAEMRSKGVSPRKVFVMSLTGEAFVQNVMKIVQDSDKGKPLAIILSDAAWTIALDYKFIDDYAYDAEKKQMISTKKSLKDLGAVKIDVPLE